MCTIYKAYRTTTTTTSSPYLSAYVELKEGDERKTEEKKGGEGREKKATVRQGTHRVGRWASAPRLQGKGWRG